MKLKRTHFFDTQVLKLKKRYGKVEEDIEKFENFFYEEHFSDLGFGLYKYRIRNSSIPTGKRGGFRIIVKEYNNLFLPLLIYSKTLKENVTKKEILNALEKVLDEL